MPESGPPDSVFVSGSGGIDYGHSCGRGWHEAIFNPAYTVKDIPFYPANKATSILEAIGGAPEWIDVEQLVRPDSPPCLIYQGCSDGMVPWETARSLKSDREVGSEACAVIYLPPPPTPAIFNLPDTITSFSSTTWNAFGPAPMITTGISGGNWRGARCAAIS